MITLSQHDRDILTVLLAVAAFIGLYVVLRSDDER